MKKVEFDLSELQKVPEKIRRQTMNKWMLKALHRYGLELESLVVDQIQDMGINFHGDLMKSIKSQVKKELNGFLLNVGTNLKTKSGYPYPVGVHEGTKPHWTPKNVIREWVRLKLNILNFASWFASLMSAFYTHTPRRETTEERVQVC